MDDLCQPAAPVCDQSYNPDQPVDVCMEGLPEPPVPDVAPPPVPEERDWARIDPPIEPDPIGQALVSLPVAVGVGAVSVASTVVEEVVAWATAEAIINTVEDDGEGGH